MLVFLLPMVLVSLLTGSDATRQLERMVVSKMRLSDLEGSESGFAYAQRHGIPVSYIHYTSHTGGSTHTSPSTRIPEKYIYSPTTIDRDYLVGRPSPAAAAFLFQEQHHRPLAPYYPSLQASLAPLPRIELVPPQSTLVHVHHASSAGDTENEGISSDEGAKSTELSEHSSESAERGEKGYDSHHKFDEADHENNDEGHREGEFEEASGHKGHEVVSKGQEEAHLDKEAGAEGSSRSQEHYHRKGHKTSGFHNVYHKDEYKKDTEFYDEAHKGGSYEKHKSKDAGHADLIRDHEISDHRDSVYRLGNHGESGHFDRGHEDNFVSGHKSAEGEDAYHEERANHGGRQSSERDTFDRHAR